LYGLFHFSFYPADVVGCQEVVAVLHTLSAIVGVIFERRASLPESSKIRGEKEKEKLHPHQGSPPKFPMTPPILTVSSPVATTGALSSHHLNPDERQHNNISSQQQQQQQQQSRRSASPRRSPPITPTLSPRGTPTTSAHVSPSSSEVIGAMHLRHETLRDEEEEASSLSDVSHFMTNLVGFHWEVRNDRQTKGEATVEKEWEDRDDRESLKELLAQVQPLASVLIQLWRKTSPGRSGESENRCEYYQLTSQLDHTVC
jgi:hypothetical protein